MMRRVGLALATMAAMAGLSGCMRQHCLHCQPGQFCPIHHTYTPSEADAKTHTTVPHPAPEVDHRALTNPPVTPEAPSSPKRQPVETPPSKRLPQGTAPGPALPRETQGSILGSPASAVKPASLLQMDVPGSRSVDGAPPPPAAPRQLAPVKQEPLLEAMRCVLENRPDKALDHLKGYDRATQELFIRLLPPMAQLSKKSFEELTTSEAAMLYDQLESLMVSLRPRTELVIGKMCFCEAVKSYGVYTTLPKDHVFQAGSACLPGERVQLYVELQNFCSEWREPYHETRLASGVEISDSQGHKTPVLVDRKQTHQSLSRKHDFCSIYTFFVPHLPSGNYTLTLQVADETNPRHRRIARQSVPFQITNACPAAKKE